MSEVEKKEIIPLNEKKVIEQFSILMEIAKENGFVHYEISNFAKERFYSKHNTAYWQNKHYLGVGPSTHSFNGESRSWNVSSNKQYILKIKRGEDYFETEKLTKNQQFNEYIFTALRTIWGVNSETIKKRFGEQMQTHFLKQQLKDEDNKSISSLTEKKINQIEKSLCAKFGKDEKKFWNNFFRDIYI